MIWVLLLLYATLKELASAEMDRKDNFFKRELNHQIKLNVLKVVFHPPELKIVHQIRESWRQIQNAPGHEQPHEKHVQSYSNKSQHAWSHTATNIHQLT